MMESIASMSMSMSAASFATNYSLAVQVLQCAFHIFHVF